MKEIKDFPGYYITEDGRVFSDKQSKLKELKLSKNKYGYLRIVLNRVSRDIHRLVAKTYIENPNNLPQVNHIDENKLNNDVSNLEWITQKENAIHSYCRWIWEIENIKTSDIFKTINLNQFSKDNNLDQGSLLKTSTGIRNHHKNFRIISKTQFK